MIQHYKLTLDFVKKNLLTFKKYTDLEAKQVMVKIFSKKILHILEDGASDVQVRDIEQVAV